MLFVSFITILIVLPAGIIDVTFSSEFINSREYSLSILFFVITILLKFVFLFIAVIVIIAYWSKSLSKLHFKYEVILSSITQNILLVSEVVASILNKLYIHRKP